MSFEVAGAFTAAALIAAMVLTIGAAVGGALWSRARTGGPAVEAPAERSNGLDPIPSPAGVDDDPAAARADLDEASRSALAACVFAPAPVDHVCWTAMVVDPALHDTPSHIRLVGRYDTEFAAVDAAAHLADELNECLIPGEAPLTATAFGIEPATSPEPLSHVGRPIAYTGTPLTGHTVPTDPDGAPLRRR